MHLTELFFAYLSKGRLAECHAGRYQDSSEVMRAALRALEREEMEDQEKRSRLAANQVQS